MLNMKCSKDSENIGTKVFATHNICIDTKIQKLVKPSLFQCVDSAVV